MLLPYQSDRPPAKPPIIVVSLVLVHYAVFGLVALSMALRGTDGVVLLYANFSLVPAALKWYAPFSYSILHESVVHLSANMLFLWVFGGSVADAIGWRRFALVYSAAAVLTGLAQVGMAWAIPGAARDIPILGASGAVAAMVGVFAARFYRSRIRFIGLPWSVPAVGLLAAALITEMVVTGRELLAGSSADSGVAHWSHLVGFFVGMVLAQSTRIMKEGREEYRAADVAKAIGRGTPLAAVRKLDEALRKDPANAAVRADLGRAWAAAGDAEHALQHYEQAIKAMLAQGNKRDAAARYRELAEEIENPGLSAGTLLLVAAALEDQGDAPSAYNALKSLMALHPAAPEAEMAMLRCASLLLKKLGKPSEAGAMIESFLAKYPESAFRSHAEGLRAEGK